jgi:hypothetical protein
MYATEYMLVFDTKESSAVQFFGIDPVNKTAVCQWKSKPTTPPVTYIQEIDHWDEVSFTQFFDSAMNDSVGKAMTNGDFFRNEWEKLPDYLFEDGSFVYIDGVSRVSSPVLSMAICILKKSDYDQIEDKNPSFDGIVNHDPFLRAMWLLHFPGDFIQKVLVEFNREFTPDELERTYVF